MQKYVGKEIVVCSDGKKLKGILLANHKDRIILASDNYEVVVAKSRISFVITRNDVSNVVSKKKSGIKVYGYFKNSKRPKYYLADEKETNSEKIFKASCDITKGEVELLGDLYDISSTELKNILGGMIIDNEDE